MKRNAAMEQVNNKYMAHFLLRHNVIKGTPVWQIALDWRRLFRNRYCMCRKEIARVTAKKKSHKSTIFEKLAIALCSGCWTIDWCLLLMTSVRRFAVLIATATAAKKVVLSNV